MSTLYGCDFSARFLTVLSILCASQVCVTVYSKAATTTFERRYGLPSTISSYISLCYNAAGVVGLLFTSLYGNRMHRPRMLGIGGLMVAAGAVLATLPQFLSPPYKENGFENDAKWSIVCTLNETSTSVCLSDAASISQWFYLLLIGEIVMGLGFSGFMTLGMSYLHDSVTQEKRAYYQGILLTIFIMGPLLAFGFILPSVSMMYVDFYRSDISMDRHDPEWVGAWWMGYIISGTMVASASLLMFLFPKNPPNYTPDEKETEKMTISSTFKMAKLIFSCKVPAILIVNHSIASIPTSALTTYGSKYLERQYGLAAHASSAYFGMVTILASMLGTFFGGWFHRKLNLKEKGAATIILVGAVMTCVFVLPLFYLGCDTPIINGLKIEDSVATVITDNCAGCDCPQNEIQLAQEENGQIWATPCAAGCQDETGNSTFGNCGCIDGNLSSKINLCSRNKMIMVLICWGLMSFTHGTTGGPYISLLLSNIPRSTKVITFGLMHLFMKIIGYAPGPMIAGKLIDNTCLFWKKSACGDSEQCQFYAIPEYRFSFTLLMLLPGLLAIPGFVIVYMKTKRKERCPLYIAEQIQNEKSPLNKSS